MDYWQTKLKEWGFAAHAAAHAAAPGHLYRSFVQEGHLNLNLATMLLLDHRFGDAIRLEVAGSEVFDDWYVYERLHGQEERCLGYIARVGHRQPGLCIFQSAPNCTGLKRPIAAHHYWLDNFQHQVPQKRHAAESRGLIEAISQLRRFDSIAQFFFQTKPAIRPNLPSDDPCKQRT